MKRRISLPVILIAIAITGTVLLIAETYGNHAPPPDPNIAIASACAEEWPYDEDLQQKCQIQLSLELLEIMEAAKMERARRSIQ